MVFRYVPEHSLGNRKYVFGLVLHGIARMLEAMGYLFTIPDFCQLGILPKSNQQSKSRKQRIGNIPIGVASNTLFPFWLSYSLLYVDEPVKAG